MALLPPVLEDSQLVFRAPVKVGGVPYNILLRFEAALPKINCYSLRIHASWDKLPAIHHEYFRKSFNGWFDFWTHDFKSTTPPAPEEGSTERYQALVAQTLAAEERLKTIPALQQEIVTAMRAGAWFSTAHKEGGTTIRFERGRFVRADYGESEQVEEFYEEVAFFAFLKKFYHSETSRNLYPEKASDLVAWKLILRLLSRKMD